MSEWTLETVNAGYARGDKVTRIDGALGVVTNISPYPDGRVFVVYHEDWERSMPELTHVGELVPGWGEGVTHE